jgi:hypothetical protein
MRKDQHLPTTEHYFDHVDARFAPRLMMFECMADDVVLRFQGTAVVERWGKDRTGESWLAEKPPHSANAILGNMVDCINTPCGALSQSTYFAKFGRQARLESLTVPLAVAPGRPGRLLSFSNLLEPISERDGGPDRIARRSVAWVDLGFGKPVHQLRRHE